MWGVLAYRELPGLIFFCIGKTEEWVLFIVSSGPYLPDRPGLCLPDYYLCR